MGRIVYLAFSNGGVAGGHKMAYRHVEALRDLGFDATAYMGPHNVAPTWFEHRAPLLVGVPLEPDDILVIPGDAVRSLAQAADLPNRVVVFAQGRNPLDAVALDSLDRLAAARPPVVMAVGPALAALTRRLYPAAEVSVVPCFADERRFAPGQARRRAVACVPRKRPDELAMVRAYFRHLHPAKGDLAWTELVDVTEAEVARAFAASTLHLSLLRLESVGMTALEAMASGCVCAGFLGVGGREYGEAANGFWVDDDDAEAAADALAAADDLVRTGGPALARMIEAGRETAARWSYARFRPALEDFWMRHAPETRRRTA